LWFVEQFWISPSRKYGETPRSAFAASEKKTRRPRSSLRSGSSSRMASAPPRERSRTGSAGRSRVFSSKRFPGGPIRRAEQRSGLRSFSFGWSHWFVPDAPRDRRWTRASRPMSKRRGRRKNHSAATAAKIAAAAMTIRRAVPREIGCPRSTLRRASLRSRAGWTRAAPWSGKPVDSTRNAHVGLAAGGKPSRCRAPPRSSDAAASPARLAAHPGGDGQHDETGAHTRRRELRDLPPAAERRPGEGPRAPSAWSAQAMSSPSSASGLPACASRAGNACRPALPGPGTASGGEQVRHQGRRREAARARLQRPRRAGPSNAVPASSCSSR